MSEYIADVTHVLPQARINFEPPRGHWWDRVTGARTHALWHLGTFTRLAIPNGNEMLAGIDALADVANLYDHPRRGSTPWPGFYASHLGDKKQEVALIAGTAPGNRRFVGIGMSDPASDASLSVLAIPGYPGFGPVDLRVFATQPRPGFQPRVPMGAEEIKASDLLQAIGYETDGSARFPVADAGVMSNKEAAHAFSCAAGFVVKAALGEAVNVLDVIKEIDGYHQS